MDELITIVAEPRERVGKGGARALRRAGRIPGVIYGGEEDPLPISVDVRDIGREIHRPGFFSRLYDLQLNGKGHRVLPREVQFHPVTDAPLHIDFLRYVAGQKVHVYVPVVFVEQENCQGLRRGGVLNVVRHEIELVSQAEAIPTEIRISLAGYDIGESVHIGAVALPQGVSPAITDRDFTIATIAAPTVKKEEEEEAAARVEEVEAAAEAEAPAEGEVSEAEGEAED